MKVSPTQVYPSKEFEKSKIVIMDLDRLKIVFNRRNKTQSHMPNQIIVLLKSTVRIVKFCYITHFFFFLLSFTFFLFFILQVSQFIVVVILPFTSIFDRNRRFADFLLANNTTIIGEMIFQQNLVKQALLAFYTQI